MSVSRKSRLLGLGFCLVFGGMLLWDLWVMANGMLAGGWPTAQGEVYSSLVVGVGGKAAKRSGASRASVLYRYRVDGRLYYGDRIHYVDISGPLEPMRQLVARFPKGARVTVHYRPDHPEESLLIPGVSRNMAFFGLFSLAFFSAGIWLLVGRRLSGSRKGPGAVRKAGGT